MTRGLIVALNFLLAEMSAVMAAPDFKRDIWPILERSCIDCHGPDKQKGGFRLDVRDIALKGGDSGKIAITPHDPDGSHLFQLVSSADPDRRMPPKRSDKPTLAPWEVKALRDWIAAGPNWPDGIGTQPAVKTKTWALSPLHRPTVPTHETNPIDAFIRAGLEEAGLQFSPSADRRTLIRRLSYNLTGLPPTPDELVSFLTDKSPRAYRNLIDRLLASPRHGEHWARHWLDVAHYADTHGNDHDHARTNAWPYRDWVIRAFNDDKPYDRFVREQIAGDALYPDDPQATVALGFLAAGPWDETLMVGITKDTLDHRMAQNLDRDDYVATVMGSFQSLTVQCARCHDHKFDPVTQKEYYQLQAVFSGIDRVDRTFDPNPEIHVQRQVISAKLKSIRERHPAVLKSITASAVKQQIDQLREKVERRNRIWKPIEIVSLASANGAGTRFERLDDNSWLTTGEVPKQDTYIITAQIPDQDVRAFRLETLADPSLPGNGPGRYPSGNFHFTELKASAHAAIGSTKGAERLKFSRAIASHSQDERMTADKTLDGIATTHWSVHPLYGKDHEAVFELTTPLGHKGGSTVIFRFEFKGHERHLIGRLRLSYATGEDPLELRPPEPYEVAKILAKPTPTDDELQTLALREMERQIENELLKLPEPQLVYAVHNEFKAGKTFIPAPKPRPIHVLVRGEIDRPAGLVEPATLACLPGMDSDLKIADPEVERNRRAALARWITEPRNVLTWRSIVNRIWHYHFGQGLSRSPNDFGNMGDAPSHPELLDWLAVWFRDEAKGSFKDLHRLILTSKTYQQTVVHNPVASDKDPNNRLLWRMNRTRLTGEQLRDSMLQLAGRLDLTMGGPAVLHFNHQDAKTFFPPGGQPAFIDYANFDPDNAANNRRSIYRFVFRTLPDPLMKALDVPDGDQWVPRRSESTTAVQAFALLNNPFVIRMAEDIAKRITKTTGDHVESQVEDAFRLILLRESRPHELAKFTAYVREHGLANAVHLLLNINEFVYLD